MSSRASDFQGPISPWWRYRMVWLVIGGPLAVVLASFTTLYLVITHPDPVLPADAEPGPVAAQPAVDARNHAAAPN